MPRKGRKKIEGQKEQKKPGKSGRGKKASDQPSTESEKQRPKFMFVCQKCGKCCKDEKVQVSLHDLERWVSDNTIYRVMHLLQLVEEDGVFRVYLKKDDDGKCNLYHRDNKECTIYASRPLSCRAFPLGFNGEDYFIKSKKCIGLGKEGMTKDDLFQIRESAFEEFIGLRQIGNILPVLYGIVFNKLIADSQAFMDKLSETGDAKDLGELAKELKKKSDEQ